VDVNTAASVSLLSIGLSLPVPAQTIDTDTQARVDRGLDYLIRMQREDGSWADRIGRIR
jgi:squalene cyclase